MQYVRSLSESGGIQLEPGMIRLAFMFAIVILCPDFVDPYVIGNIDRPSEGK